MQFVEYEQLPEFSEVKKLSILMQLLSPSEVSEFQSSEISDFGLNFPQLPGTGTSRAFRTFLIVRILRRVVISGICRILKSEEFAEVQNCQNFQKFQNFQKIPTIGC